MVNNLLWAIKIFDFASFTLACGVEMSNFVPNDRCRREVLTFSFHSKKMTRKEHRELQNVCEIALLSGTSCCGLFYPFKHGDFDIDDNSCGGRTKTFEKVELEAVLDEDPNQPQKELVLAFRATHQAISKRFHALRMIENQEIWVPDNLKSTEAERWTSAFEQQLQKE